jgi:hypothetical protein
MSDWRQQVKITRAEGLKAAGIIAGLLLGCIFVLWLLTINLRKKPPTPTPPVPVKTPAPAPGPVGTPATPAQGAGQ